MGLRIEDVKPGDILVNKTGREYVVFKNTGGCLRYAWELNSMGETEIQSYSELKWVKSVNRNGQFLDPVFPIEYRFGDKVRVEGYNAVVVGVVKDLVYYSKEGTLNVQGPVARTNRILKKA